MKKLLKYLNDRLEGWLHNRYGLDELSLLVLGAATVTFMLAQMLRKTRSYAVLLIIAVIMAIWAVYRCFSHNISGRSKEEAVYMKVRDEVCFQVSMRKKTWEIRKSYRYFRCKECKCRYRVPKRKGKIQITCPNCKKKTIRRT